MKTSRRSTGIICLLMLLILPAAYSCATDEQTAIKTLEDIPGGFEGPEAQDIGAHSVRIVFKSGTPVVCNVAFGTDTGYGRLSLMAMTGPLIDHDVQLIGLKKNTVYHFKVTVTDLSSNVYQSEDLTFTTIEGSENAKPEGRNVAAAAAGARVLGVSSNWGGGGPDSSFGANKATDGDPRTEWSSDSDGNGAWIEIELDQTYDLNAVGFWTRTMGNSGQISSFEIITDSGEQLGPFDVPDASTIYYYEVQTRAKRLRFETVNSSGGNTGAIEIEAYSTQS